MQQVLIPCVKERGHSCKKQDGEKMAEKIHWFAIIRAKYVKNLHVSAVLIISYHIFVVSGIVACLDPFFQ